MGKHIAIIQGHPDASVQHYGHALADEYAKGCEDGSHEVKRIEVALLVQFMRVLKGTVEDEQGDEAKAASIPLSMKRRVPIRESRGPSEEPRVARPAMEEFPTRRRWQPRIAANARDMRCGLMLMTVPGSCRGREQQDRPSRIG